MIALECVCGCSKASGGEEADEQEEEPEAGDDVVDLLPRTDIR